MGNSGLLSSCVGYFGKALELPKGSLASFHVPRGNSGLLSSSCRGKGPHLTLQWEYRGFSQVQREAGVSSSVVPRTSGSLSYCPREVKTPFELRGECGIALKSLQGNRASSSIEVGISLCFSCCIMKLWVSLEFQGGPQGTSHFASGKSDLLSSLKGNLEIPLEWLLGNGV